MTIPDRERILAFASCARFLGAAVLDHGVRLRVTRVAYCDDAELERVRLTARLERVIAREQPGLVVLATGGPLDDLVHEVLGRKQRHSFDCSRAEIARVLDTEVPSVPAIRTAALARLGDKAPRQLRAGRTGNGPRSELDRYWAMGVLALGAALAAKTVLIGAQRSPEARP